MKPVRDLLKHSSVYAIGQILTRLASVLLLPMYTHCLTPADYGATAILDLTAAILSLMIGAGMVMAVTRFHFDSEDAGHHDRLWWTGMTFLVAASTVVLLPLWAGRQTVSDLTLGHDYPDGGRLYTLTFATVLVQVVGQLVDAYLRVLKWSGVFVVISLGRLLLNVGLNVLFLVGLDMGVEGLLLGNLSASLLHTSVLLLVFVKTRGRYCFDVDLSVNMLRFSGPVVVTALLSMLMHEADRYFLRIYRNMDEVGLYSLAHKIGFAVNTLLLLPFASIWHVAIYDIEKMPDPARVFRRVFKWFVSASGILLLGAALTVHPILPLLTPDAYGESIDLISVILLGFFFFGLQLQFEVPALLSKRTGLLIPGSIVGVLINVVGNFLLVPHLGAWGAGWVGVVTYVGFSFTTLFACRRVMPVNYQWGAALRSLCGFCVTYMVLRYRIFPAVSPLTQLALSVAACSFWAITLFGRDALQWWSTRHSTSTVVRVNSSTSASESGPEGLRDDARPVTLPCCERTGNAVLVTAD